MTDSENPDRTDNAVQDSAAPGDINVRYITQTMSDGERASVILKGMKGKRLTNRRTDRLAA